MERLNERQKKRIKAALHAMRHNSDIKYEIIRDVHGMDPSQIENGDSFPNLSTLVNYCRLFKRCPGWLVLLSSMADQGKISEIEFIDFIENWNSYQPMAEIKSEEFISMVRKGIRG